MYIVRKMNTIVFETVKQIKSMAKNAGLNNYSRMKTDDLLELIRTKTEHTVEHIPKPATKKSHDQGKTMDLKGVGKLLKHQLLTKVCEKIKKDQVSMIRVHEPIRSIKGVLTTWKIASDAEMDIQTFLEVTRGKRMDIRSLKDISKFDKMNPTLMCMITVMTMRYTLYEFLMLFKREVK